MNEIAIRFLLGLMVASFLVVRMINNRRAVKEGGKIEVKEKNYTAIRLMRAIGGMILVGALLSFFFWPDLIGWADFSLPDWLRWGGLVLGYLSVVLIWWTEFSLGKNFSTYLHVREGHTLVVHGPYRWVRHPMYTGLFGLTLAWLLASANWLVGLPGLLSLMVIIVNRVSREEAVMIEQFGDEYRTYMKRTGRFFPRLMPTSSSD